MCSKLFLVTRADLLPGQQAIQSAHALREFSEQHPEIDREWYRTSNTLIMKAVPNEEALQALMVLAQKKGFHIAPFQEPDLNNELTAIAFEPRAKSLMQGLPLALKEAA